ncbi:PIN-like domain-containing protein [Coleofasciculus sp. E2-BRE-01]|uniref:PIN-like domain-containing protein n=1 Tax=Coleofasciculus sp. E2-BRE-01 TaxID=3069524 RepID=UPI0032F87210
MRDLFPGYYRPTSEEEFKKIWQEAIFSFDANILLNIYRYSSETRERLFDIIEYLKERIWIPHQVAYEYQKERLTVISQQSQPYDQIRELLNNELKNLKKKLEQYSKRHSFTACVDTKTIIQTIERANKRVYKILEEGREKYPDLLDDDKFRDKLTNLLEGKVGKPYSNEELDKIYKDTKKRKFLEYASSFLKLTEQPEAIEEAREVRRQANFSSILAPDIQRRMQASIVDSQRLMKGIEATIEANEKTMSQTLERLRKYWISPRMLSDLPDYIDKLDLNENKDINIDDNAEN